MKESRLLLRATTALTCALLPSGVVYAQESQGESALQDASQTGTGEIIVTAQRRAESVQDVPISISVVTGEALQDRNINDLETLGDSTPGLKIARGGAADVLAIRGTGSGANSGFEQSVSTFLDGVVRARGFSTRIAFFDVDRVEVLKGPQSTFFGANAIAGAINITTKKPGNEIEANVLALSSPSDGEYNLEGGVSVPLSGSLGVRVSGRLAGMDGYVDLDRAGGKGPNLGTKQGRISAEWRPVDALTINARYDIARIRDKNSNPFEVTNCPPPEGSPDGQCARNLGIFGTIDDVADGHSGTGDAGYLNLDLDEGVISARLELGGVAVNSITAYSEQRSTNFIEVVPLPAPGPLGTELYFPFTSLEDSDQFSQEIRLESTGDGPLSYMLGGYYEKRNIKSDIYIGFFFAPFGAFGAPVYTPGTPVVQNNFSDQSAETLSAFGSVSYELTDRLTLTGGLRYSSVRKTGFREGRIGTADEFATPDSFEPAPASILPALAAVTGTSLNQYANPKQTDSKLMPSANVRYEFSPDVMVYASYARGFKAGGFSSTTSDSFRPETVDSYEAGVKARWLGRRLTTNLTIFRMDYSDLQEAAVVPVGNAGAVLQLVTNAAESRSQGAEFSSRLSLGDLTLNAELAYLDSYYVSYPFAQCPPSQGRTCTQDISGSRRPLSPEWSGSVGGEYRIGIDDRSSIRLGGQLYFSSWVYGRLPYSDLLREDGYAKLDLRAGIGPDDKEWEFAIIAKNVTDNLTSLSTTYLPSANGSTVTQIGRPRSIAVQVSARW